MKTKIGFIGCSLIGTIILSCNVYAGYAVKAGDVVVETMSGEVYESNYYPDDELFRIKWSGLKYSPVVDMTKMDKGGDNYAALSYQIPIGPSQDGKLGIVEKNNIGEIQPYTNGTYCFENLTEKDVNFRKVVVSFTVIPENTPINSFCKSYQIVPSLDIDREQPVIENIDTLLNDQKNQVCTSVTLIPNASDATSGLSKYPYSWDGGKTWTAEKEHMVSKNGIYVLTVKDKVKKEATRSITVSQIDEQPPVILEVTKTPLNMINSYAKSVLIKVNAMDEGVGLHMKPYSFDGGMSFTDSNEMLVSQNGVVAIWVRDKVGNIQQREVKIDSIDDKGPKIENNLQIIGQESNKYGRIVELQIEGLDSESGIGECPYSWDEGITWVNDKKIIVTENKVVSLQCRDRLLNTSTLKLEIGNIDRNPPILHAANLVRINEVNGYCKECSVKIEAEDTKAGLHEQAYSFNGGITYQKNKENTIVQNETVDIAIRDGLSNICRSSVSINCIDREAPTIKGITEKLIDQNGIYGKSKEITIEAEDKKSGIHLKPYSFDDGLTWTSSNSKEIHESTPVIVAVRDSLFNISKRTVIIDDVDNCKPTIRITGNPTEKVNRNVTLTFYGTDNQSGIASLWIQNDAIRAKTKIGDYVVTNSKTGIKSGSKSVKEKIVISTNGSYRFFLYDYIGNLTEYVINVNKIDRTIRNDSNDEEDDDGNGDYPNISERKDTEVDSGYDQISQNKGVINQKVIKNTAIISDNEYNGISDNNVTGETEHMKIVRLSGNDIIESNDVATIEETLEENLAQADQGNIEIKYPEKQEKDESGKWVKLGGFVMMLFTLISVSFLILYKSGVIKKQEEES
ncbi:MAG: hypothetical protein PHY47_20760 [Lachnospiraceae bacterium]|nr:hypothetical protein [Lachnospiraceae bacterium]